MFANKEGWALILLTNMNSKRALQEFVKGSLITN